MLPLMRLFTVGVEESGERHLFLATSARYPPADVYGREVGVALPEGSQMAQGSDWEVGSGCYLVGLNGETVGNKKLLDSYHELGRDKKIWEYTLSVFEQAGVKVH